jgi:hypothetical protein
LVEVADITILTTTVGTLQIVYTITQKWNQHTFTNNRIAKYDVDAMDAKDFVYC